MVDSRWEEPKTGALLKLSYNGRWKDIENTVAVAQTVRMEDGEYIVTMDGPVPDSFARFDPDSEDYGTFTINGDEYELYSLKESVPPSQVRYPGVEEGDTVKLGTGSTSYRVEEVDRGMVMLADGRRVPVTHITAFDEDVDDHDPFSISPEWIQDIFGGDGNR